MINIKRVGGVCNLINRAVKRASNLASSLHIYMPHLHRVNTTSAPVRQVQSVEPSQPVVPVEQAPVKIEPTTTPQPVVEKSAGPVVMFSPPKRKQVPHKTIKLEFCKNWSRPDTHQQCTNQVRPHSSPGGACPECLHKCEDCGQIIPIWFPRCKKCKEKYDLAHPSVKKCRGYNCDANIPLMGPNYCSKCGHKCKGCDNIIPKHHKYCLAQECQDLKWAEEHSSPAKKSSASAVRAKKKVKSDRDKAIRLSMRGNSNGKKR